MAEIFERIKELREKAGISQEELASLIGTKSRETVKFWESGTRHIKETDIIKIAKLFDVSADYLLGLTDVPRKGMTIMEIVAIHDIVDELDSASLRLKDVLEKEET